MTKPQIKIDGTTVQGFKSFTVSRSLDDLSASFSITADDSSDILNALRPGALVNIYADNFKLITGRFYNLSASTTNTGSNVSLSGYDVTRDLIRCSIVSKSSTWINALIRNILSDILQPFGIGFNIYIDDSKVEKFTVQPGESAFSAIQRLCRIKSALPVTERDGTLSIKQFDPGITPVAYDDIIYGVNATEIIREVDYDNRYQEYFVKGQNTGKGSSWSAEQLQQSKKSSDAFIDFYSPKVIVSESNVSNQELQQIANWEAQIRAGRSQYYTAKVNGSFLQSTNDLWDVGYLTNVDIKKWSINKQQIISGASYTYNMSNGTSLDLVLKDIYSYTPAPNDKVKI